MLHSVSIFGNIDLFLDLTLGCMCHYEERPESEVSPCE